MSDRDEIIETMRAMWSDLKTSVRSVGERVDSLAERVDQNGPRIDAMDRRVFDSEVRLATEMVAIAGAIRELRDGQTG